MMIPYISLLTLLVILQSSVANCEDRVSHSAYKVTSYNLGAVQNSQKNNAGFKGQKYSPLMITSTTSDILNSEHQGAVSWVETNSHTASSRGIALSAEYIATDKIALRGAFGVTRNLWAPDSLEYEQESSWEANLGFIYKLVNNLSYELHFGYMDTGDLFTDQSTYTDVENIIMISNRLSMSF
ncbi:MAG: hypothetical protein GY702_00775 [Desulfobulbaceae bacterium]|nr:hypothetical protein [Desulfobulbaceae bacterium]